MSFCQIPRFKPSLQTKWYICKMIVAFDSFVLPNGCLHFLCFFCERLGPVPSRYGTPLLTPRGVLSSNQLINPKTHTKVSWALKLSQSHSVGKTMTGETAAWTLVKIIVRQSPFKNMKVIHRTTAEIRKDIRCFTWVRTKGTGLLLSGTKSFFHMKVNFAFHLEIQVPEAQVSRESLGVKRKRWDTWTNNANELMATISPTWTLLIWNT